MNALTSEHTDSLASEAQGGALLRVSADKVGRLMDLVGELSLSVSETIRSSDLEGLELTEFEKSAHRLMMVVREVQDAAAELRLVPVGDVFRRMRRTVRELERTTGKEIDLVLEGEDTRDRQGRGRPSLRTAGACGAQLRRSWPGGARATARRSANLAEGASRSLRRRSAATFRSRSPMMGVVSTADESWLMRASAGCSGPKRNPTTPPCGR